MSHFGKKGGREDRCLLRKLKRTKVKIKSALFVQASSEVYKCIYFIINKLKISIQKNQFFEFKFHRKKSGSSRSVPSIMYSFTVMYWYSITFQNGSSRY